MNFYVFFYVSQFLIVYRYFYCYLLSLLLFWFHIFIARLLAHALFHRDYDLLLQQVSPVLRLDSPTFPSTFLFLSSSRACLPISSWPLDCLAVDRNARTDSLLRKYTQRPRKPRDANLKRNTQTAQQRALQRSIGQATPPTTQHASYHIEDHYYGNRSRNRNQYHHTVRHSTDTIRQGTSTDTIRWGTDNKG